MAQIKKIVKPGDLIRGASVGLAGLDKDGNVVGYKAAAADAGKVLTVGEDGSVTPAPGGGGGTKYLHQIFMPFTGPVGYLYYINDSETPFTTIGSIVSEIFSDKSINYRYPIFGTGWTSTGYNTIATYLWKYSEENVRIGGYTGLTTQTPTETDFIGTLSLTSSMQCVDHVSII